MEHKEISNLRNFNYDINPNIGDILTKKYEIKRDLMDSNIFDQNKKKFDSVKFMIEDVSNQNGGTDTKYQGNSSTASSSSTIVKLNRYCSKLINRNGKMIKIFECDICNKEFSHQYTLMRHLPMHTNARNFICTECGKAFRQLSTLSQHRAIHSVDRPFQCETCDKCFNRISTLISHRKTHTDEKPYRCHLCQKGFHQKGNLRNHIYIHTNVRPYRCTLCNKGFNQMSNLVCHTQKAHSTLLPDSWPCNHCPLKFQKRSLLRNHEIQTHHFQSSSKSTTPPIPSNKTKTYSTKNTSLVLQQTPLPTTSSSSTLQTTNNIINNEYNNSTITTKSEISHSAIIIPAIDTDAMKKTKKNNEIPFAILHFIEGQPLLVRVIDFDNKSLLRPVNIDDFSMLRRQQQQNNVNNMNISVEILMPIVAAIFQTVNSYGESNFIIKSPKNIYKLPNLDNLLNFEYNKNSNDLNLKDDHDKMQFDLNKNYEIDNNNNKSITTNHVNKSISNEIISEISVNIDQSNNNTLINQENNNVIDDNITEFIDNSNSNWWKKDDTEKQQSLTETKIENFIKNDQFLNIENLPKKDEQLDILPTLNFDNMNFLSNGVTSTSSNGLDDDVNINIIRNFLTENRKFFADIADDLVAELFQQ